VEDLTGWNTFVLNKSFFAFGTCLEFFVSSISRSLLLKFKVIGRVENDRKSSEDDVKELEDNRLKKNLS
jgi:hypothetical protein